eukprot:10465195-Heterocapsa_arctica.AAC.1
MAAEAILALQVEARMVGASLAHWEAKLCRASVLVNECNKEVADLEEVQKAEGYSDKNTGKANKAQAITMEAARKALQAAE